MYLAKLNLFLFYERPHMDYMEEYSEINPIEVRMKESQKGVIYESIVAMGFRARQINDDFKEEISRRMADVIDGPETEGANFDQIAISREFDKYNKPTFIAMREIRDEQLKYELPAPKGEVETPKI